MNKQIQKIALEEFIDSDRRKRIEAPTETGSALPNAAYTSQAFYDLEQQTVFRNNWIFATFAHQIPDIGDMQPLEVAGQPVVLVRGEDQQIRAFHNVCRHRGAKLVTEPARGKKTFICPNHSWSYSLEGQLMARPHFYGGGKHDINHDACHRSNLVEIRSATWHDWVFINIDGHAGSFAEHIKIIEDKIQGYDFSALKFSSKLDFEINANWKLALENFIEPYHVFSCHPWLNSFVNMEHRTPPAFEQHVLYCGYQFEKTDPARGEGLPYFPNLSEQKKKRGDWFVLFPNFSFEVFPDQVDVFIATPLSATRSMESIALYFINEGADQPEYEEARNIVIKNWHDLNQEDIGVIERMQAGRASEGFDGGVLSPYWDPVQQQFARLIVNSMESSSS